VVCVSAAAAVVDTARFEEKSLVCSEAVGRTNVEVGLLYQGNTHHFSL